MMTDKEINELVAEKIMGYEWVNLFNLGFNCIALNGAPFKDNRHLVDSRYLRHFEKIEDKKGYGALNLCSIPDYCNDIAAAWGVVEKFNGQGFYLCIQRRLGLFVATFIQRDSELLMDGFIAQDGAAPKAICLAVLKSLGYDVEKE